GGAARAERQQARHRQTPRRTRSSHSHHQSSFGPSQGLVLPQWHENFTKRELRRRGRSALAVLMRTRRGRFAAPCSRLPRRPKISRGDSPREARGPTAVPAWKASKTSKPPPPSRRRSNHDNLRGHRPRTQRYVDSGTTRPCCAIRSAQSANASLVTATSTACS